MTSDDAEVRRQYVEDAQRLTAIRKALIDEALKETGGDKERTERIALEQIYADPELHQQFLDLGERAKSLPKTEYSDLYRSTGDHMAVLHAIAVKNHLKTRTVVHTIIDETITNEVQRDAFKARLRHAVMDEHFTVDAIDTQYSDVVKDSRFTDAVKEYGRWVRDLETLRARNA